MSVVSAPASSLSSFLRDPAGPTLGHAVQFYEDDDFLCERVAEFLAAGFAAQEALLVIATDVHRDRICTRLEKMGFDVEGACESGRLVLIGARECLSRIMAGDAPDWSRLREEVGGILAKMRKHCGGRLRAYGEMVDLLLQDGLGEAAVQLETYWNELCRIYPCALLCAYALGRFQHEVHGHDFRRICDAHNEVLPTEAYSRRSDPKARLREVSVLQQRAHALESELERSRKLEKALREALEQKKRTEEELRASQKELLDFFENAAEGLHRVGPGGTILWANRAELALLGYSASEYVGHNIAEFHADPDIAADILSRLARNETLRDYEAPLRCKDGTIKHTLIHSNALFRNGTFVHTRCSTRDITDRKRLEEKLLQENEELSRTVRFSEMFVGILGHDLRNPLSAITTAASLLVRRSEAPTITKPAGRILNSAGRMARMIDQLLDFTRIRLGKGIPLERRRIDLAEVCRMTLDELDVADAASRVELRISGDPVGLWDGDRLAQLVSNLLGNALAHGKPGVPVIVRIDALDPSFAVLEVKNEGSVPPDVLPVLFEPLRSVGNRKEERSSGLGLGLFISQQIALAHSGTIEAFSSEEEGTRLLVRLPKAHSFSQVAFTAAGDKG